MNKLTWKVLFHNRNANKIEYYDIFSNGPWEAMFRSLKTVAKDFTEWEDFVRQELRYHYWCRSEYEIVATSWPPDIKVDEVNRLEKEIANRIKTYGTPPYRLNVNLTVGEKIDIFSQIDANWEPFIHYVWNYFSEEENK